MRHGQTPRVLSERPFLLIALVMIGYFGCAALIVGTLWGQAVVPDYNWMSDTISDLAAGEGAIVMDVALYGSAAGLFAVFPASAHVHLGGLEWLVGVLSIAVLAALVIIIGARNEYGGKESDGVVPTCLLFAGSAHCLRWRQPS